MLVLVEREHAGEQRLAAGDQRRPGRLQLLLQLFIQATAHVEVCEERLVVSITL